MIAGLVILALLVLLVATEQDDSANDSPDEGPSPPLSGRSRDGKCPARGDSRGDAGLVEPGCPESSGDDLLLP